MHLMSALIYFWHKQHYNFYNVRPRSNEVTEDVDFTHLITNNSLLGYTNFITFNRGNKIHHSKKQQPDKTLQFTHNTLLGVEKLTDKNWNIPEFTMRDSGTDHTFSFAG